MLTHRIAYLVATGAAKPNEILAITFTNKAAGEMRDRAELLVGRRVRAMWVMTFHAACARMLRAHADKLGYTRRFTIYDQADARRLIKRCLDELGIDPKRFTPSSIHNQISDAKNKLRDADSYAQMVGSFFEQTVADVYRAYEREMHRMNAMDFDDLLVRAVNVLELFQEVRDQYAGTFRHVLVDEYQDTNHAQYRWLQLLAEERRNLMVVGDDAQCLVAGTLVTMADGSSRAIEDVSVGEFRYVGAWWRLVRAGAGYARAPLFACGRCRDHAPVGAAAGEHARAHALRGSSGGARVASAAVGAGVARASAAHNSPNRPPAHGLGDISAPEALMLPAAPRRGDFGELRTAEMVVTLCAGERQGLPVHRLAVQRENGAGFDGLTGDMRRIGDLADSVARDDTDAIWIRATARLGADGGELPFTPASAVEPRHGHVRRARRLRRR